MADLYLGEINYKDTGRPTASSAEFADYADSERIYGINPKTILDSRPVKYGHLGGD